MSHVTSTVPGEVLATGTPQDSGSSLLDAVTRLHAALDALGDALSTWSLDELTAASEAVGTAFDALSGVRDRGADMRDPTLVKALRDASTTLRRCRRLGTSLDQLVWRGLRPTTGSVTYGESRGSSASVPSMLLHTEA